MSAAGTIETLARGLANALSPLEHGLSPEDIARMQRELANVSQDLKLIEESHGDNVLNLVVAVGYLRSLVANSRILKFLGQHYAAILTEFQKIIEAPELDSSGGS